jgi:hypothetical protein
MSLSTFTTRPKKNGMVCRPSRKVAPGQGNRQVSQNHRNTPSLRLHERCSLVTPSFRWWRWAAVRPASALPLWNCCTSTVNGKGRKPPSPILCWLPHLAWSPAIAPTGWKKSPRSFPVPLPTPCARPPVPFPSRPRSSTGSSGWRKPSGKYSPLTKQGSPP